MVPKASEEAYSPGSITVMETLLRTCDGTQRDPKSANVRQHRWHRLIVVEGAPPVRIKLMRA
jgi:hypothetical protein